MLTRSFLLLSVLVGVLIVPVSVTAFAADKEIKAGDTVVTSKENAKLMSGTDVLAELTKGTKLKATEVRGVWIRVSATVNGQSQTGWVINSELQIAAPLDVEESNTAPRPTLDKVTPSVDTETQKLNKASSVWPDNAILALLASLKIKACQFSLGDMELSEAAEMMSAFKAAEVDSIAELVGWLRQHPDDAPCTAILENLLAESKLMAKVKAKPLREAEGEMLLPVQGLTAPVPTKVGWLEYDGVAFAINKDGQCVAIRIEAAGSLVRWKTEHYKIVDRIGNVTFRDRVALIKLVLHGTDTAVAKVGKNSWEAKGDGVEVLALWGKEKKDDGSYTAILLISGPDAKTLLENSSFRMKGDPKWIALDSLNRLGGTVEGDE